MFNITTLRDGVYWYTASVLYVWPLLPFFGSVYFYLQNKKEESNRKKIICMLLTFLAAFSQEQVAVMTVALYAFLSVAEYLELKRKGRQGGRISSLCGILGVACIGSMLTICAPGNFVRAGLGEYQDFSVKHMIIGIIKNTAGVININVGSYNWLFLFILTLFLGAACSVFYRNKVFIMATVFWSICYLMIPVLPWRKELGGGIGTLWLIVFLPALILYYFRQKKTVLLSLLIGGICSQAMLIAVPTHPLRCHIILEFILHIILAECIIYLQKKLKHNRKKHCLLKFGIIVTMLCAVCNLSTAIIGYGSNYAINQKNHQELINAKSQCEAGEKVDEIILYKLYNDNYANMMPYQRGYEHIETWIKRFYELPDEVEFRYRE